MSCGCMPSIANETTPPRSVGVRRAVDRDTVERRRSALERVGGERALVGAHGLHAEARRGSRPRRRGRRASAIVGVPASNFHGQLVPRRALARRRCLIMWPPPMNGGMASSSSRAAVQDADAGGPERLVPGPGVEVGADGADVDAGAGARPARRRSRDARRRRGRGATISADRVDRAEHVGHVGERGELDVRRASSASSSSSDEHPVVGRRRASAARRPPPRHSSCQGTMFEWCSSSVISTASPAPTLSRPHA